jgi:hypothetical protein
MDYSKEMKWIGLFLILFLLSNVQAKDRLDSLKQVRDSLLAELGRVPSDNHARMKLLSSQLYRVEFQIKQVCPKRAKDQQGETAHAVPAQENIYTLQAKQSILEDQLNRTKGILDSLMTKLTEININGSESAGTWERGPGFEADPKKTGWNEEGEMNPETEQLKSRLVASIDSLKVEIKDLKQQLEENKNKIKMELKGGTK